MQTKINKFIQNNLTRHFINDIMPPVSVNVLTICLSALSSALSELQRIGEKNV